MSIKKAAKPQQGARSRDMRSQDVLAKAADPLAIDAALDEALEDSFPASDPPQMTQASRWVGGPRRARGGGAQKPGRGNR